MNQRQPLKPSIDDRANTVQLSAAEKINNLAFLVDDLQRQVNILKDNLNKVIQIIHATSSHRVQSSNPNPAQSGGSK